MIKNYIFDIDGTLINTIDMYMPAMIEILEKHGYLPMLSKRSMICSVLLDWML